MHSSAIAAARKSGCRAASSAWITSRLSSSTCSAGFAASTTVIRSARLTSQCPPGAELAVRLDDIELRLAHRYLRRWGIEDQRELWPRHQPSQPSYETRGRTEPITVGVDKEVKPAALENYERGADARSPHACGPTQDVVEPQIPDSGKRPKPAGRRSTMRVGPVGYGPSEQTRRRWEEPRAQVQSRRSAKRA